MCKSNEYCWGNGICDPIMNNRKHCYDGGDCDYVKKYDTTKRYLKFSLLK